MLPLDGVQHEWTIVIRYTHDVQKSAEGWMIRRGNPLGIEFVRGKRLV